MSKRLYIGNMSYATTEDTLSSLFSAYGEVVSATIIMDRDTGQSKGFGFVELADDAGASKAIAELSGKEVDGRKVRVNYAEEKKPSDRSGFGRDRGERPYRGGGRSFRSSGEY